jgi:transcriptional regulator with XRE-family HTH domain
MSIREVLGKNLRLERQRLSLSQEELASRAKVDRTYISAIERGVYGVTIDVLDRIATALGVESSDLLKR